MAQNRTVNYPIISVDLQKTTYLALYLQHPAKMQVFSFLLELIVCWTFHMFGMGKKTNKAVTEGRANTGSVVANLGEALVSFFTSQRAENIGKGNFAYYGTFKKA